MIENRAFLRAFAVLAFFTALAGDAWRYSISWYGFAAIAAFVIVVSVILLVRQRHLWRVNQLPYPLLIFVALCALSTAWSDYPGWTALGTLTTISTVTSGIAIAATFSRAEIVRHLGTALKLVLGLSVVFELFVSVVLRAPLLPFWYGYKAGQKLPMLDYWSRDLFLAGGKIQGIVGNSSLLAMVALLGLIVFGIQLASRTVSIAWGIVWLAVAALCVACTRSATIIVAIAVLAVVVIAVLLARRYDSPRGRLTVYGVLALLAGVAALVVARFHTELLALLGKGDNLTGRVGIWTNVIHLAQQRPAFGWGWVSYWVPFIEPFKNLASAGGVRQLHAHNAWLDVWLQLGILGLVVFGCLVVSTLVRSWQLAVDRQRVSFADPGHYTAASLLPLLLLVALLVQSTAESRLLIEYGLLLLTICAVTTKLPIRRSDTVDV
ncbi:O-antigen ligase family protein [Galbitalea soli]|uniref:O-antigen ligase family protein n=1 Tax=Galbitalea soli TaxID=1268042 RepID=A0A7C9PN10_9MICO|nr:O-antigen ligase family protein [Galbitalea soli]NEM91354.1 O-antigen ligase family protein [Galbitalea soli]NYJ30044.1 O-antigen ligase [Galbitalea soli]